MINLLPLKEKNELLAQDRKKMVVILGIILVVPLICFGLILLSLRFYILGEINLANIVFEQAKKQYQTADFLHFKDVIKENNKTVTSLQAFYKNQTYMSALLAMVSQIPHPESLYFTSLSLQKDTVAPVANQPKKVKVIMSGFSKSRDDLLLFQKNIQSIPTIEKVYFTPESWINPVDLKFNLTFEISKLP